ncbi:MAG: restriction endonuclease [Candidatus Aenigmarchaeota archaeon]|nr:restriction endonuclease [Candidatus Aenigmarchaeota archaeon]
MLRVIKASGKIEKFDENKIRRTCERAGVSKQIATKIAREVKKQSYDNITTKEILKITLKLLRKHLKHAASRYDLKGALMRLGPAGFQFEKLVAKILTYYGYKCKTNVIVKGAAIEHEIDILASKDNKTYHIEAKYHNFPGIFTGIKDVLYTYARFLDLKEGYRKGISNIKFSQTWLVTNTKFSPDAIKYANYKNIKLLGWRYPEKLSLEKMIEEKKLYPVTVLRSVSKNIQYKFSELGIMLCKDIIIMQAEKKLDMISRQTGISKKKLTEIVNEADKVLG